MPRTELNGFDETGTIGNNLRFVRVGMEHSSRLRPFVYNILHFGSVAITKGMLRGVEDDRKRAYVRMALMDPSIDVDHYVFTSEHQLNVLRQFTLLESKSLFRLRSVAVNGLQQCESPSAMNEALSEISTYLRRYERSPYWMESFVKSYGFRMIVSDLCRTSRTMKRMAREDVRVISHVDGGYPFVFWWYSFLSESSTESIRFCLEKTPIYGITKGDEYYPVVSMAGNIAFITNTTRNVIYPHVLKEVPRMPDDRLNSFYNEYKTETCRPRHIRRVLFIGTLPNNIQFSIPYILCETERTIFEPYHISWNHGNSLRSFYRDFGWRNDDLFVIGKINNTEDGEIVSEVMSAGNDVRFISDFSDLYLPFLHDIQREADSSCLHREQIEKVNSRIERAKQEFDRIIKSGSQ